MKAEFEITNEKTPLNKIRKDQYYELLQQNKKKFVAALIKSYEKFYLNYGAGQMFFIESESDFNLGKYKFGIISLNQLFDYSKRDKSGLSLMFWYSYKQIIEYGKNFIFFDYVNDEDLSFYFKVNRSTLEIEEDNFTLTDEIWEEYQKDIGQRREKIFTQLPYNNNN